MRQNVEASRKPLEASVTVKKPDGMGSGSGDEPG